VQKQKYSWQYLIEAGMVGEVVNDCGWRDIWPLMAKSLSWHYGVAGVFGFHKVVPENRFHDLGHSDFLRPEFARTFWKPFFSHGEVTPGSEERPTTSWWRNLLGKGVLKYALLGTALLVARLSSGQAPTAFVGDPCFSIAGFEVDPCPLLLETGEKHRLAVGRYGEEGFSPFAADSWTSDDEKIAWVDDETGEVEGIAPGSTGVLTIVRDTDGVQMAARGQINVQNPMAASPGSFLERLLPERRVSILVVSDFGDVTGDQRGRMGGIARVKTLRDRLEEESAAVGVLTTRGSRSGSTLSLDRSATVELWNRLDGQPERFDDALLVAGVADLSPSGSTREGLEPEFLRLSGDERSTLWQLGELTLGLIVDDSGRGGGADVLVAAGQLREQGAQLVIAVDLGSPDERRSGWIEAGKVDLVIGVHDSPLGAEFVDDRWRFALDASARTALVLELQPRGDLWRVDYRSVALSGELAPDPDLAREVAARELERYRRICERLGEAPDCLSVVLAHAGTDLIGNLESIRTVETALGDWVADTLLESVPGADVAFINAGALRLHDTILAGEPIHRSDLFQLLPFDNSPVAVSLSGRQLRAVVEHAAASWRRGGWLQVAGLAFSFDPETRRVGDLTLLGPEGPRPVQDRDEIVAVTIDYLARFSGDGYEMLSEAQRVSEPGVRLQELVAGRLERAGVIEPRVEGRICYPSSPLCRAIREERTSGDRLP
jgi:hypothetical protein